jgi:alanine racemase
MAGAGRPTQAEINLDALEHNLALIKKSAGDTKSILAVVKADAYGHGAVRVARALADGGVDFLGVATCEEGMELRQAAIKTPIIVLGGAFPDQGPCVQDYDLIPVVYNLESAQELSRSAGAGGSQIKVHIKIDTGMGRLGIMPGQIRPFFQALSKLNGLEIHGVLTHLADTNGDSDAENEFTRRQIEVFQQSIDDLSRMGIHPPYTHLANSAAIMADVSHACNLVRPGIMLYGIYPSKGMKQTLGLEPVMRLTSRIVSLKEVPRGTTVSYGRTFTCERESRIAALPIGYADGYSRALSNRGEVLVQGKRAPVAGVVCMDMTMIDVTGIPGVALYDEVVLLGSQGTERITAQELADRTHTIPYEVLCAVSARVPRVYYKNGKPV